MNPDSDFTEALVSPPGAGRGTDEVGGRRAKRRQEKRRTILTVATRLFSERDPDSVSMDEIAREAEFATGTLYTYFPSKEILFYAAAQQLLLPIQPEVIALLTDSSLPPLARLHRYLFQLHSHIERHRTFFTIVGRLGIKDCPAAVSSDVLEDGEESCEAIIAGMMAALTECLAEAQCRGELRADFSPSHLAESMRGIGRALTEFRHRTDDRSPIEDHANLIYSLFLSGAVA